MPNSFRTARHHTNRMEWYEVKSHRTGQVPEAQASLTLREARYTAHVGLVEGLGGGFHAAGDGL